MDFYELQEANKMPRKVFGPTSMSPMTKMEIHTFGKENPPTPNFSSWTKMALNKSYAAPNHMKEYTT